MFTSIFTSTDTSSLSVLNATICILSSLILGAIIAFTHKKTSRCSNNFLISLTILPLLVQVVIMMVNGNLGTSVAVLGAFSLVRFRSIPGDSKEIMTIFWAMAVGLAIGMGHIVFALVITIILTAVILILNKVKLFGKDNGEKVLKIIIPENLDYTTIFNDIFEKYIQKIYLEKAKTTNMGSMFELTYNVNLKPNIKEKELIDEIRCRNGNLTVTLSRDISREFEL